MKFLVDMPLSPGLAVWLAQQGHDAVHARDLGLQSAADTAIMDRAKQESRTIVTADLDYPRLLALARASKPSLILFRDGDWSATTAQAACMLDHAKLGFMVDIIGASRASPQFGGLSTDIGVSLLREIGAVKQDASKTCCKGEVISKIEASSSFWMRQKEKDLTMMCSEMHKTPTSLRA